MAYLGKTPSQATRARYYYTATGGETSLSGADDNANTLTFTDGNFVDVMLNGVTLVAGTDYNTTTANTIGGLTALVASDIVEIVVYDTFSVFGGDVNGDFTIQNGTLTAGAVSVESLTTTGDVSFGDNDKAIFGAGSDLQIYSDGTTSFISESGSGNLKIQGNTLRLEDSTGTRYAQGTEGAAFTLMYAGSSKLATTSTGIDVTGTVVADDLDLSIGSSLDGIQLTSTGANILNVGLDTNRTGSSQTLTQIDQKWDGTSVAKINFVTGSDTTNKDDGEIRLQTASAGTPLNRLRIEGNGDISFYEDTGTTAKLFWDASAESLGIGTTSPDRKLAIGNYTDNEFLRFQSVNTGYAAIEFGDPQDGDVGEIKYDHTDNYMWFRTSGSEAMRIASNGEVTVGVGTAVKTLNVYGNDGTPLLLQGSGNDTSIAFSHSNVVNGAINSSSDGAIEFRIGGSGSADEAMRIDSSGNVGIGTTSPTPLHGSGTALVLANNGNATLSIQATDGTNDRNAVLELMSSGNGGSTADIVFGDTDASPLTASPLRFIGRHSGSSTERMRIDSSGNLLVGTTSTTPNPGILMNPTGNVTCGNSAGSSGFEFLTFRRSATQIGSVTQSGTTAVAYNTSSDYRLKENVVDMAGAITRVKALAPKRFNFIADDDDTTVDGFLAHEAQTVVPEAITGTHNEVDDDGNPVYQGIDQSKLVPLLTGALQEAIAKIETLETTQADLLARITTLEGN